jgi:hypothetical protein
MKLEKGNAAVAAAADAGGNISSDPTGSAKKVLSHSKKNPTNDIKVMLAEGFEAMKSGSVVKRYDVSLEPTKLDGYSSTSVNEALAEILTVRGDESLEVSSNGVASTVGRRVYSKLASRLVSASTLTTTGTNEDDQSFSNQSMAICSERSVLVQRPSDVSDDAQGSVELNLSGRPLSTTGSSDATSSSSSDAHDGNDDTAPEGNVEVDSSGLVDKQSHRPHLHHQRPTVGIPGKVDPLEQASNNILTSRATNASSKASKTKMKLLISSNTEHWSQEVDLPEIGFNRTSSSLTSKRTRTKMENVLQQTTTTTAPNQAESQGNVESSHEVDLEDHIVVCIGDSFDEIALQQQGKTAMLHKWSMASKSQLEVPVAGQSLSNEVELDDLLQFTTAPTRITSNMTSPQSKTNIPPHSCVLPGKSKSSYWHKKFGLEDSTAADSIRTIEFGSGSRNDNHLRKEGEKETSHAHATTAENYTLLQIVDVPQAPFMGKEQQSSGGGDDTERLLIRKTSTRDTEEDMFDEEAQSEDAAFEVTVHDSERTIAVMLLEEWMESSLQRSGTRQQQKHTDYRRMKQVMWSVVAVLIVAGIISAVVAPIILRRS